MPDEPPCRWCQSPNLQLLLLSLRVKDIANVLTAYACADCGRVTITSRHGLTTAVHSTAAPTTE